MDLKIVGKTALVVGASKGIGRAVVEELHAAGCRVIAVARDEALLGTLDCEWRYAVDLMQRDAVERLTFRIRNHPGIPEIIYHAIGGSWCGIKATAEPAARWAEVWRYNLGLAIDINNAFLPDMLKNRWGRIVHTSSDAVAHAIGNAPYASAKFALEGYVKVVAKQYAKENVIISAVSLGPIYREGGWLYDRPVDETRAYFDAYLPTRRFGTAAEAAKAVAFMCSEHSSFMAGSIVNVHGGSR